MTSSVEEWVDEVSRTTHPDRSCGATAARPKTTASSTTWSPTARCIRLNQQTLPNCFLHRSNPQDVARTEHLTFICSETRRRRRPDQQLDEPRRGAGDGSGRSSTTHAGPHDVRRAVPHGPVGSPYAKVGVEITDSPYVVANMRIMTRMGKVALDRIKAGADDWVPGLHSLGDLSPDRRFIAHFPETRTIWSVGSGYGGNALLGKKCFALRIASTMGRDQGWLAEHMLILGLESPDGDVTYIAGAFPSACGKTNLAMLKSPLESEGWKVWTVGDDIAWINIGPDGRLWAINPESGLLRRRAGHQPQDQPERDGRRQPQLDLHQRGDDRRRRRVVGRHGRARPRAPDRLAGQSVDARHRAPRPRTRTRASPRPPRQNPVDLAALGRPAGRADQRDPVRRPPRAHRAAGLPGVRLGARRVPRRHDGLRDDRRGHRRGRRGAPRSDGHAALLRLQHGRLLGATGSRWAAAPAIRRRSSRSTGSAPTTRAASSGPASARTCACCAGCATRSLGNGQRERPRDAGRPGAHARGHRHRATSACPPPTRARCSTSIATTGCAKPRTRASSCSKFGDRLPPTIRAAAPGAPAAAVARHGLAPCRPSKIQW